MSMEKHGGMHAELYGNPTSRAKEEELAKK
jgi:hypothetical protein